MKIEMPYEFFEQWKYECQNRNIQIIEIDYQEKITCLIQLSKEEKEKIQEQSSKYKILSNTIVKKLIKIK